MQPVLLLEVVKNVVETSASLSKWFTRERKSAEKEARLKSVFELANTNRSMNLTETAHSQIVILKSSEKGHLYGKPTRAYKTVSLGAIRIEKSFTPCVFGS
jgi:hypothetical protein